MSDGFFVKSKPKLLFNFAVLPFPVEKIIGYDIYISSK
jgi:hypothetical protein